MLVAAVPNVRITWPSGAPFLRTIQPAISLVSPLAVTVTVRMPDGSETAFLLEPAGLSGGRLRARDCRADIERTLPLSHIVAVAPAS